MNTLTVAQTIFYFVASLVLIGIGVFILIAAFRFLSILKDAKEVTQDIKLAFSKTKQTFNNFFGSTKKKK